MKALHIRGCSADAALYTSPLRYQTTSGLESPAVCSKLGMGWVRYIGDVNAESETTQVVLAILNLFEPSVHMVTTGYAIAVPEASDGGGGVATAPKKKKKGKKK